MADPVQPSSAAPDDEQNTPEPAPDSAEFEVEAHAAGPLDLQAMDVNEAVTSPVLASTSATSLVVCC